MATKAEQVQAVLARYGAADRNLRRVQLQRRRLEETRSEGVRQALLDDHASTLQDAQAEFTAAAAEQARLEQALVGWTPAPETRLVTSIGATDPSARTNEERALLSAHDALQVQLATLATLTEQAQNARREKSSQDAGQPSGGKGRSP